MRNLLEYDNYLFDCDGVILDSNRVKSRAFYDIALQFGEDKAEAFQRLHEENAGISRFVKIERLLREFAGFYDPVIHQKLIDDFGSKVQGLLRFCQTTKGFFQFIEGLPNSAKKYVVSGGARDELIPLFREKEIDKYFNEIFGSPATKFDIVENLRSRELLHGSTLFIGDARLDYEVAVHFGFDYLFISHYSDFKDWRIFFADKKIRTCATLEQAYLSGFA